MTDITFILEEGSPCHYSSSSSSSSFQHCSAASPLLRYSIDFCKIKKEFFSQSHMPLDIFMFYLLKSFWLLGSSVLVLIYINLDFMCHFKEANWAIYELRSYCLKYEFFSDLRIVTLPLRNDRRVFVFLIDVSKGHHTVWYLPARVKEDDWCADQ